MISGCKLAYGWTLLVVISSLTEGALQGSSGDQACLHGQRETSDNCGTNGSEEADGAIEQHVSPQTTTASHATGAAAVQWSSPADPDRCAPGRLASLSCRRLPAACLSCRFNASCVYGANVTVLCRPADGVACTGVTVFNRTMVCRYCYQTPAWQHDCSLCNMMSRGRKYYRANCTVAEDVVCMGQRTFHKRLFCKWTKGDRWSTALALSVVLGGFGVDRFYLGHWQEGIGKFFSFGGLGVWTLIDVVLIAIGYLSPADGSLYIT